MFVYHISAGQGEPASTSVLRQHPGCSSAPGASGSGTLRTRTQFHKSCEPQGGETLHAHRALTLKLHHLPPEMSCFTRVRGSGSKGLRPRCVFCIRPSFHWPRFRKSQPAVHSLSIKKKKKGKEREKKILASRLHFLHWQQPSSIMFFAGLSTIF